MKELYASINGRESTSIDYYVPTVTSGHLMFLYMKMVLRLLLNDSFVCSKNTKVDIEEEPRVIFDQGS